jgi:K+-sensing histidine kinase KdpD
VERFLRARRSAVILAAVSVPLVACAVLSTSRDSIANTTAALGLVLLIVAAASTGIRAAGYLAACSCAAWFDFFLTQPYNQFAITDPGDIETAALLVLVGVAVTEVALWGHRQQARASREQGYLNGVLETAATVGVGGTSTDSLIEGVSQQIRELLDVDRCTFDQGHVPVLAVLNDDATMTYNSHPFNPARRGLPTDAEIALPVQHNGVTHGRYLLTAASHVVRPTPEQLRVAIALANQVGAAIAARQVDSGTPTIRPGGS